VYCVWLLIEFGVVFFFYIETRYTPLEEIAKHFDGEDAVVGGAAATHNAKSLAMELGGLDTVDVNNKSAASTEQKEL
jgi:hypothetical protein